MKWEELPGEIRHAYFEKAIEEYNRDYRGIDVACSTCGGSGIQTYGSTATWHGGIGGAAMTSDVCDKCWGTGNAYKTGVNLRLLNQKEKKTEVYIRKLEGKLKKLGVNVDEI